LAIDLVNVQRDQGYGIHFLVFITADELDCIHAASGPFSALLSRISRSLTMMAYRPSRVTALTVKFFKERAGRSRAALEHCITYIANFEETHSHSFGHPLWSSLSSILLFSTSFMKSF